jgi:hypothetical protein
MNVRRYFSEHNFDAKRQRVSIKPTCMQHQFNIFEIYNYQPGAKLKPNTHRPDAPCAIGRAI